LTWNVRSSAVAKAAEIAVHPFEPYALAAARVVRVRADELVAHSDGVLDTSDIERVHDMRVASRRLRAVLEVFGPCFPKKELRRTLREVKALADDLGERRDPDVAIAALERVASELGASDRAGIESLESELAGRQGAANELLAERLERTEAVRLRERLLALAAAARAA
jgi:CHAD domain-containing protein